MAQVRTVANAYRQALADGDRDLASDLVERKILYAVVANSATETLNWIQTRAPDGDTVGQPLEELAPALERGNVVGAGLKAVEEHLKTEASSAVVWLFLGGATPVWLASVVAFAVGAFGFAQEAGASLGALLIPVVLGGGAVLGVLVRGLQYSGPVFKAAGETASSLWSAAGSIGWQAEQVFSKNTAGLVSALRGTTGPPTTNAVLRKLRGGAQTVVFVAFLILGLCVVFFMAGLNSAYEAYTNTAIN